MSEHSPFSLILLQFGGINHHKGMYNLLHCRRKPRISQFLPFCTDGFLFVSMIPPFCMQEKFPRSHFCSPLVIFNSFINNLEAVLYYSSTQKILLMSLPGENQILYKKAGFSKKSILNSRFKIYG